MVAVGLDDRLVVVASHCRTTELELGVPDDLGTILGCGEGKAQFGADHVIGTLQLGAGGVLGGGSVDCIRKERGAHRRVHRDLVGRVGLEHGLVAFGQLASVLRHVGSSDGEQGFVVVADLCLGRLEHCLHGRRHRDRAAGHGLVKHLGEILLGRLARLGEQFLDLCDGERLLLGGEVVATGPDRDRPVGIRGLL